MERGRKGACRGGLRVFFGALISAREARHNGGTHDHSYEGETDEEIVHERLLYTAGSGCTSTSQDCPSGTLNDLSVAVYLERNNAHIARMGRRVGHA